MPENASHLVVHHYFDNAPDVKLIGMACCIALSVVIVLLLLIVLAFLVYMVFQRAKSNDPRPATVCETLQNTTPKAVSNSYKRDALSRKNASNPDSMLFEDVDPNPQNIPMSTFEPDLEAATADSSDSSAGLCEVLFPPPPDGEIIYEPPPKLVTFAGRVYAASGGRPVSVSNSEPRAGVSGTRTRQSSNFANSSMEWDYFESRHYGASNASDESGTDRGKTVDICWV